MITDGSLHGNVGGVSLGGAGDGVGTDDFKPPEVVAVHELGVEHALDVVETTARFGHVEAHREGVKVLIHVAKRGEREKSIFIIGCH